MATESYVQVAADGAGKLVDAVSVVNPSSGATQYRQTVAIGDGNLPGAVADVGISGDLATRNFTVEDLLLQMLIEIRVMNSVLVSTLNCRDDLDALRMSEAAFTEQLTQ